MQACVAYACVCMLAHVGGMLTYVCASLRMWAACVRMCVHACACGRHAYACVCKLAHVGGMRARVCMLAHLHLGGMRAHVGGMHAHVGGMLAHVCGQCVHASAGVQLACSLFQYSPPTS